MVVQSVEHSKTAETLPYIAYPKKDHPGLTREGYFLLDPEALRAEVLSFVSTREALAYSDSDFRFMSMCMINELFEAEAEENLPVRKQSYLDWQKELIDVIFFVESYAFTQQLQFDNTRICSLANGVAKGSVKRAVTYDYMRSVAGNLVFDSNNGLQQLTRGLEYLLALLYAKLYQMPVVSDPLLIMKKVMSKNARNYPREYFGKADTTARRELQGAELLAKYRHSVACLRMIRTATGNSTEGLEPWMHKPFAHLIADWRNSENAKEELRQLLARPEWVALMHGGGIAVRLVAQ